MSNRHMLPRMLSCAAFSFLGVHSHAQLPTCDTTAAPTLGTPVSVANFGASPSASASANQAAIQNALNSLTPGQVLTFPPGIYQHNSQLKITQPGSVIDGSGATLVGTSNTNQALMIQASDVEVRNLTISNVTSGRQTTPWASGIAAFPLPNQNLQNIRIINNRIIASGTWESDTAYQNSTSAAGIFIYNVDNFIVFNNLVEKSRADAIHVTAGSRNGKITHNVVKSSGDDGIALVSYQGTPSTTNPDWLLNVEATSRVRNVLIASNSVSHVYWGRGITVVGGKDVTIKKNHVHDIFGRASILIARERNGEHTTLGVSNVVIDRNFLADNQTTYPNFPVFYPHNDAGLAANFFNTDGSLKWPDSGQQASIEVHGNFGASEKIHNGWQDSLIIKNINISRNLIERPKWAAVRVGEYSSEMLGINVTNNVANNSATARSYSVNAAGFSALPYCTGNLYGDASASTSNCTGTDTRTQTTGFSCQ